MSRRGCGLLLLVLSIAPVQAQIYRWVDENGQVHFSDTDPGNAQTYTPQQANVADPYAGNGEPPSIRIFTAEWCGVCKKAKQYMRAKDIAFVEYDIEKDPHGRNEYRMLGGRGVPLITIGDQIMHGFSPGRFEKLLNSRQQND